MTRPIADDVQREIAALEKLLSPHTYTEEEINHAEALIKASYSSNDQAMQSSASFFAGTYRTENKKFKEAKTPEWLRDPDHPNESRDRWVSRVHDTSTAAHFSKPQMREQARMMASLHQTVNELPEKYLVFIKGQCMESSVVRGDFLVKSTRMFWCDYQSKIKTTVDRALLSRFAEIVIASGGDSETYFLDTLRRQAEVKKSLWYKSYLPHWRAMLACFGVLRQDALSAFLESYLTRVENLSTLSPIRR